MGSLGPSLAAWLLLPAVLYVLSAGLGLLVERLTRFPLPPALVAPVGFCAAVALVMPGYRLGAGWWLAVPLLCAAALAGLLLARRELPQRLNPGAAGIAGLGIYALYIAPVVLAGGWTWTGYNFVNDTAVQFLLADHLAQTGATVPAGPPAEPAFSTGSEHVRQYLETSYPLGIHALLGTLEKLVPAPLAAIYQPTIAAAAGFAAMALVPLARRAGLPVGAAVAAAGAALAANLTFNYALQGNAKEIGTLAAVAIAAAAGRELLDSRRAAGGVAVVAVCFAAAVAFFSAAAVPYVGAFAAMLLLAAFVQPRSPLRRSLVRATAVGAVVLVAASASTIVEMFNFGEVAQGNFQATNPASGDLGHLLRPLRLAQTAGIWLVDDYRLPVPASRDLLNDGLLVLALALLVLGVVRLARRRETGALMYAGAVMLTLAVVGPRVSPYASAKLLAIASPAIVLLVAVGLHALATAAPRRRRLLQPLAITAAVALAAGVVASDLFAYRAVQLAPIDRMEALADMGDRYAGDEFVLVDDKDEFAKYFMREARQNVAMESVTPLPAWNKLRQGFIPGHADLDQMPFEYVSEFETIVQRRGADSSRPPSGFERDSENAFYTAWTRRDDSGVKAHVGLQEIYQARSHVPCGEIAGLVGRAARGDRLLVSHQPEHVYLDTANAGIPGDWQPHPSLPNVVRPLTPGTVEESLEFEGGTYRIWMLGSFGRDIEVRVDGRAAGRAHGVNTPGEWLDAGTARISRGNHRIELVRGGADLSPGDRYIGWLGPVVFERTEPAELESLALDPTLVCAQRLDWIELVEEDSPALSASAGNRG